MLDDQVRTAAHDLGFSGVVRVDRPDEEAYAEAFGLADRALAVANTVDTRFAIASGVKGMTAMTVLSLVAEGRLDLETTARSLLGDDLPEIDDAVTVEQLLAHRSGIGDYFDEESSPEVTDHVLTVPVHTLVETEDYLPALDGFPQKFPPGERFSYCNGAFVVLALLAERSVGRPFRQLVEERVCRPAGLAATAYLRSDELPGDAAKGYLGTEGLRTNVLHLPVRGSGDGGIYSTVADIHRLWAAFMGGAVLPAGWVREMVRPRSEVPDDDRRYGLGVWLAGQGDGLMLVGHDAGVSFFTEHVPATGLTWTVVSNTSEGAWDMVDRIEEAPVG